VTRYCVYVLSDTSCIDCFKKPSSGGSFVLKCSEMLIRTLHGATYCSNL